MTEIKKNERFIPLKNYIISGVIIIGAILLTFYGFEWYKVIKENKVSTSYLIKEKVISKEITDLDELESVLTDNLTFSSAFTSAPFFSSISLF